jgi:hypothetical protein
VSQKIELTDEEIEIARKAVEDELISMRDSRIGLVNRRNGLCVAERDGTPSSIIRLGMEHAMNIAIKAINQSRGVA